MYYRIDWEALNRLPAPERLTELANIIASVQRVCGAERDRMVHAELARHGGPTRRGSQKAAAQALGMKQTRTNQIAKATPVTVRIITRDEPAELYRRYQGEREPQPCYVEVDLEDQTVLATYDAEQGNIPGVERRYPIPALTSKAANKLLEKIRPLAERMCSDWEKEWDGNNHRVHLGPDAQAAEAEIQALCGDKGVSECLEDLRG